MARAYDLDRNNLAVVFADPGGLETGIVARAQGMLVGHRTVTRAGPLREVGLVSVEYNTRVTNAVIELAQGAAARGFTVRLAAEGITPPSPHMGVIATSGLLASAVVLGAISELSRKFQGGLTVVRPARFGSAPLRAYPEPIRGVRNSPGNGQQRLRHCRQAWDGAGEAVELIIAEHRVTLAAFKGGRRMGWRDRAICQDEDPDLFFPTGTLPAAIEQTNQAKAVCARCPVVAECLRWALLLRIPDGVFGGRTEQERAMMLRRQQGRRPSSNVKMCALCGTWKPYNAFDRSANRPGRYEPLCRSCSKPST